MLLLISFTLCVVYGNAYAWAYYPIVSIDERIVEGSTKESGLPLLQNDPSVMMVAISGC